MGDPTENYPDSTISCGVDPDFLLGDFPLNYNGGVCDRNADGARVDPRLVPENPCPDGPCVECIFDRTWSVAVCDARLEYRQNFIVPAATDPSFAEFPEDAVVDPCADIPPAKSLAYNTGCPYETETTGSPVDSDGCGTPAPSGTNQRRDRCSFTRTWTAPNLCGSPITKSQTITLLPIADQACP
jgi:hypothetical protein